MPVTILFFRKFCFILRTFYKELIWCTNHPNVHIHTFQKRWSFVWGCFFPVSILKHFLSTFYRYVSYLCCTLKKSKFTKQNAHSTKQDLLLKLWFSGSGLYFVHLNEFQTQLCAVRSNCPEVFCKIHRKTPVMESLFQKFAGL